MSLFAIAWLFCTSFAFIFLSRDFGIRYVHLASFGYILLLLVSIDRIARLLRQSRLLPIAVMLMILVSGTMRTVVSHRTFKPGNEVSRAVRTYLAGRTYPLNSQVAVIGDFTEIEARALGSGIWQRTDIFVKCMLRREDMSGITGNEHHFYDPFDVLDGRCVKLRRRMTGLDLRKPIFVFRCSGSDEERSFSQLEYGLQWMGEGADVCWRLYRFNAATGGASAYHEGGGLEEYRNVVENLRSNGIANSMVAWGDLSHSRRPVCSL